MGPHCTSDLAQRGVLPAYCGCDGFGRMRVGVLRRRYWSAGLRGEYLRPVVGHQAAVQQLLAREVVSLKRVFANSDAQAKDDSVPVSVFLYQCLPDTMDPRGPKGK